ncbi:MAG: hypothetical protein JG781_1599 [Peptococcaceae bacterium]|jgi:hypothetical protein|nr:hypothetical protein [Peptococcaceae bacterium]
MEEIPMDVLDENAVVSGITPEERKYLYFYFAQDCEEKKNNSGFCLFRKLTKQICKLAQKLLI